MPDGQRALGGQTVADAEAVGRQLIADYALPESMAKIVHHRRCSSSTDRSIPSPQMTDLAWPLGRASSNFVAPAVSRQNGKITNLTDQSKMYG
jgi:hypothetical protein